MKMCGIQFYMRWFNTGDFPEVLSIEERSFVSPWTEEEFRKVLKQRNAFCRVITVGPNVVAYVCYELLKNRIEIHNLAVHEDFRREGIASELIRALSRALGETGRSMFLATIDQRNTDAHLFFQRLGFRCIRIMKNYYGGEYPQDAYLFRWVVGDQSPVLEA